MTNKPGQLWSIKFNVRDLGRLIWCAVGATTGIGIALWFVDMSSSPFLLASIGGSTMFLFGLTRATAAQPRALFGGHLGGALIGVLCSQAFGDALWVYMLANMHHAVWVIISLILT